MKRMIFVFMLMSLFIIGLMVSSVMAEVSKATQKSEYVGSTTCQKCHKVEYDSWKLTFHSKMVRKKDEGILKNVVDKWKTDGFDSGPTTGNVTGAKFTIDDVQYTIGSNWKQRFLVKDESTGGYQFLISSSTE